MAEISANLTVAWLDAFARLQMPTNLLNEIQRGAHPSGSSETLTNVIERALQTGGGRIDMQSAEDYAAKTQDSSQIVLADAAVPHLVDLTV